MKLCFILILWLLGVSSNETIRRLQTSPAVVVHEWLPGENNKTIITPSTASCALMAFTYSCLSFDYQDPACSLAGCGYFSKDLGNGEVIRSSVFQDLVNVAKNKPTYSSNAYPGHESENVVDDNNCRYESACGLQTYSITNPWFLVDIGTPKRIVMVDVGPCNRRPMTKIEIRIGQQLESNGNFSSYQMFGNQNAINNTCRYLFSQPDGIVGRFISIQRMVTTNLFLCDVEVLASNN